MTRQGNGGRVGTGPPTYRDVVCLLHNLPAGINFRTRSCVSTEPCAEICNPTAPYRSQLPTGASWHGCCLPCQALKIGRVRTDLLRVSGQSRSISPIASARVKAPACAGRDSEKVINLVNRAVEMFQTKGKNAAITYENSSISSLRRGALYVFAVDFKGLMLTIRAKTICKVAMHGNYRTRN